MDLIMLKGMTTQLNRKSVVAIERIRKLVGEWSCLKWATEMITAMFPSMVVTIAPIMTRYMAQTTYVGLAFLGQELFVTAKQNCASEGLQRSGTLIAFVLWVL